MKHAFIENNHIIVQDAKVIVVVVVVVVVGYDFIYFSIKDLIRIIVEWNESCLGGERERERDHIEMGGCALCGSS